MTGRIAIASIALLAGCSNGSSSGGGLPTPPVGVAPTPTPSPSASPTAGPTPAPSASPTATPTPAATTYSTFADVYISRSGAGVVFPSACSALALSADPPVALPVSLYGQGVTIRHVQTPQVWAIAGDGWSLGFDGRFADTLLPGEEVAHVQGSGSDAERFSVARPIVGTIGTDYARLVSVAKIVSGVKRHYRCVLGYPTLVADLPTGSIAWSGVVAGLAYVRDGGTTRTYALDPSTVTIAADMASRRVTLSVTLRGLPGDGTGVTVTLGTLTASATIDPANGNFAAPLTSTDRTVSGGISGRLFGPQGIEIAVALGAAVNASSTQPAYSVTAAAFGVR